MNPTYRPQFNIPAESVISTLSSHMLVDGFDIVMDLERSSGSHIREQRTGRTYVDFFSCIASMPIGFNHPAMATDDFVRYIGTLALNKPSNSDIYCSAQAIFVETFFKLAVPDSFRYAFFIEGGTLAVENALKAAFDWKVRKNHSRGLSGEVGHQVIHFERAFHGRSGYCLSLTNTDATKTALFPRFQWPRIPAPALSFPVTDRVLEDTVKAEQVAISLIKEAFVSNPNDIAAIIIEPIQGEGGDNHFRPEFFRQLRTIADENEALLIFDEVQTGVGLTGRMWVHERIGVTPDIMVFGKKMQVCGIVCTERIDEVPENVFHTPSRINSTWGGNLVDMVRATRYLEIIAEEKLVELACNNGDYLASSIEGLVAADERFSNARGMGLFRAVDLPSKDERDKLLRIALKHGLLAVGSGTRSIRFRPALNITQSAIDEGIEILNKALSEL